MGIQQLVEVMKHLLGQHDQATHDPTEGVRKYSNPGDKGSKPVKSPVAPNQDRLDREELASLRKARFMTYAQEQKIKILQARIAVDPSKWHVGDGVGMRVSSGGKQQQINRGFRIVAMDPAAKLATIRQVADTGLTTSGGDYDKFSEHTVHIADLVKDKKYNSGG